MLKTVRFYTQKFTTTVYIILICKKKVRLTFSLIFLTIRVLSSTKHCISTFNCFKNLEAYQYKVSCHKPLISGECYLTKKRFTSRALARILKVPVLKNFSLIISLENFLKKCFLHYGLQKVPVL